MLDLRWTYAGPTLALSWTYVVPKLDLLSTRMGTTPLPCFVAGRDERQRVKPQRRLASPAGLLSSLLVQARALARGTRYPHSAPIDILLMQILAGAQSAAPP